jgi:phosphatidate cytidylyltransferase
MLVWRLVLGTVLVAAVAALCWLDARAALAGVWLFPLALTITLLASGELLRICRKRGVQPAAWPVYLGNAAIVAANWRGPLWPGGGVFDTPALALGLAAIAVFVAEMWRYRAPGQSLERLAAGMLALVYVGWLMSFLIQHRFLAHGTLGLPALAALIIVVKMCDTGAYTVGRLIGRHKMTPTLSPGKTFEGLAGGLAFACLGAWFAFAWLVPTLAAEPPATPAYGWIAYGLVVGLGGVAGDLAESLLKRDAGVKDSSAWMPGFGGVLDIVDSLLVAAPLSYLFWARGWV